MKKVILVNLGGPRNILEIEKFLTDLFTDPYIFDLPLPRFVQLALGKLIAKRRASKVRHAYESLNYGGGSPLVDETIKQAAKLEERLNQISNQNWQVSVQMTCGFPNLKDIRIERTELGTTTCILPLYPQYSRSTTLSALKIVQSLVGFCPVSGENSCLGEACANHCKSPEFKAKGWIGPFYKNSHFIEASVSLILDFLAGRLESSNHLQLEEPPKEDWREIPILFSAHGIPMRLIRKGDPYPEQVEETMSRIVSGLNQHGYKAKTYLSYQSKVGPAKWTEPSTLDMLASLGKKGVRSIAVYPISFVSDHLETLEEIGVQLKQHALNFGIEKYYRIPALGTYPKFIDALANIVISNFSSETHY